MSEWAINASTRFVTQESLEADRWMQAQLRYQSLLTQAPQVWARIAEALTCRIRSFNECVGKEVLNVSAASNKRLTGFAKIASGRRGFCADFDAGKCTIVCSAYSMEGTVDFSERYGMAINADNKAALTVPGGCEYDPEQIAERMLNGLMGWK